MLLYIKVVDVANLNKQLKMQAKLIRYWIIFRLDVVPNKQTIDIVKETIMQRILIILVVSHFSNLFESTLHGFKI